MSTEQEQIINEQRGHIAKLTEQLYHSPRLMKLGDVPSTYEVFDIMENAWTTPGDMLDRTPEAWTVTVRPQRVESSLFPEGEPIMSDEPDFAESLQGAPNPVAGMQSMRPVNLQDSGLLYFINKLVFHPRGYMLGLSSLQIEGEDGPIEGIANTVLMGDGSQPVGYGEDVNEVEMLALVKQWLA